MKKKIVFGLLFTLLVGCSSSTGPASVSNADALAQCLTERGVRMYGVEWCNHCQNQKTLFGESFRFIDYVDCDRQRQQCDDAGVTAYPTWNINGTDYPGVKSLDTLAALSGCEI